MTTSYSILQAMSEPDLWGGWFKSKDTWEPWRAFLASLFGLPMSDDGLELFHRTPRPPTRGFYRKFRA
jgi:hypothetical protein